MTWNPGTMPDSHEPEAEGLDRRRLALADDYLQGYVDREKLAGCSFAVMRTVSR